MIFHAYFLNAQPALTDLIKVCLPGTSTAIGEQLYLKDGTTPLANPFTLSIAGTVKSWAFTPPEGVVFDLLNVTTGERFAEKQIRVAISSYDAHLARTDNPHVVTAAQAGAEVSGAVATERTRQASVYSSGEQIDFTHVKNHPPYGSEQWLDPAINIAARDALTPSLNDCILVQDDGDGKAAQYWYDGATWQKIGDVDWTPQTDSQVKAQYENNSDTNAFTDAEKGKVTNLVLAGYLRSEAQFNALAAANRDKFAGSGFIEWGKHGLAGGGTINEGLWVPATGWLQSDTLRVGRDTDSTDAKGVSKSEFPIVNVNGSILRLFNQTNNTEDIHVLLPPAPSISTLPERQDLVFLELWHEKVTGKDVVYPFGNVQSLLATDSATSLATVNGSFTGFETYSLFGNWQASSALIGKGLVWSTMSITDQQKFVADPENNCYLAADGGLVQVRYRIRVVEGPGADWSFLDAYAGGGWGYDGSNLVTGKGQLTSTASDVSTVGLVGYGNPTWRNTTDRGVLSTIAGSALAYNSEIYFLPIALVSRRNQGAFHPVFNPNGTAMHVAISNYSSIVNWHHISPNVPTSTADCFGLHSLLGVTPDTFARGGDIATTWSGRPDNKFYDAIYEGDVKDLRNSAHKQDLTRTLEREFNKLVAGEMRGWEKGLKLQPPYSNTIDGKGWHGTYLRTYIDATGLGTVLEKVGAEAGNEIVGWILSDVDGKWYSCTLIDVASVNNYAMLSPHYGDVSAQFTVGQPWKVQWIKPELVARKSVLACDIIGDPANYPASWVTNGVMGNALLVGEEGEDYLDTGTHNNLATFKLSRKAKGNLLLAVRTDDAGATWFSGINPLTINSTTNKPDALAASAGYVYLLFYEAEASPFELAANAEVLELGDVWAGNYYTRSYGASLSADLINKIAVGVGASKPNVLLPLKTLSLDATGTLYPVALAFPTHDILDIGGTENPAVKVLPYLTRENGKLFLHAIYKEMKFNVTWGDDSKSNIINNESTTTDDNSNTVLIGQKRLELPYFIGDGE